MKWMQNYLRTCADIVGLAGHEVVYAKEPVKASNCAEMACDNNQTLRISFAPEFPSRKRSEQRRIVAHELAHGYFSRFESLLTFAKKKIPADARKLFELQCTDAEEEAVERLARVFEKLLPLPRGQR